MYAYERLEKLIYGISNNPERRFERFFIPDTESFEREFLLEVENIETDLTRQAMSVTNESAFKMMVQQYQAIVTSMLDNVLKSENQNPNYPKSVYQFSISSLRKLFSFLSQRFANFFNYQEKAPDIYILEARQMIKGKMALLEKHLSKQNVNKEIQQLVFQSLQNFVDKDSSKRITCRELLYFEKMVDHFSQFRNNIENNKNEDAALFELLVFINFNTAGMSTCIINKIFDTINVIEQLDKRVEEFTFYLKMFNQFPEKSGIIFKDKNVSLKEQVTGWLLEEIYFIEKKWKNTFLKEVKNDRLKTSEEKLHLSISVDVLTIIARAAKDSKLIVNKHSREMYQNISSYVRTKNAENLSVNSMIKKSYVAERGSKEKAIDMLHEMIKKIHSY